MLHPLLPDFAGGETFQGYDGLIQARFFCLQLSDHFLKIHAEIRQTLIVQDLSTKVLTKSKNPGVF